MNPEMLVFGYLGPETFIPLMSFIAAGVGILLAFGKSVWAATSLIPKWFAKVILRK